GRSRPGLQSGGLAGDDDKMGAMDLTSLILFLVIGLVAGFLASVIMRRRSLSILGNLIVGVLGALLGGFLFGILGLHAYGLIGQLVVATAGAVVLLWLIRMIR
ncbi:MAG: GlsB/YeaQ/YmgE family stress response membrane protein, partial [Thermoanaerobaculia bacterium]|nr:GlsB/YeaQ/YmgE family stress response membrane protein [Thermoanaerobaculia bacterium]